MDPGFTDACNISVQVRRLKSPLSVKCIFAGDLKRRDCIIFDSTTNVA